MLNIYTISEGYGVFALGYQFITQEGLSLYSDKCP